jgi:hypothetical protein
MQTTAPQRMDPEQTLTVPYTLEGSRHDRVLDELLTREQNTYADCLIDRSEETFDSAAERQQVFDDIITATAYSRPHVLVSEFYLYDDAGWRDETAVELDIARFDRDTQTVYCIESKGRNLESLQADDDELNAFTADTVHDLTTAEKEQLAVQKAVDAGTAVLDDVQDYMNRFGWTVDGMVAAFYQYGKTGETRVELYPYTPVEGVGWQ